MDPKTILTVANALMLMMTIMILAMTFCCGFRRAVWWSERKFMGKEKVLVYPSGVAYHFDKCTATPKTNRAKEITITQAEDRGKTPCMCPACDKALRGTLEKTFKREGAEKTLGELLNNHAERVQFRTRSRLAVHAA